MDTTQKSHNSEWVSWFVTAILFIFTALSALIATQLPDNQTLLMHQPIIQRICQHIDCTPFYRNKLQSDLSQIHIGDNLIYQSADSGTFRVRFTLHNKARFAQMLPSLVINAFNNKGVIIQRAEISHHQYTDSQSILPQTMRSFEFTISNLPMLAIRYDMRILVR